MGNVVTVGGTLACCGCDGLGVGSGGGDGEAVDWAEASNAGETYRSDDGEPHQARFHYDAHPLSDLADRHEEPDRSSPEGQLWGQSTVALTRLRL